MGKLCSILFVVLENDFKRKNLSEKTIKIIYLMRDIKTNNMNEKNLEKVLKTYLSVNFCKNKNI